MRQLIWFFLLTGFASAQPISFQLSTGVVRFARPTNFYQEGHSSPAFVTHWGTYGAFFTVFERRNQESCDAHGLIQKELELLKRGMSEITIKSNKGNKNQAEIILTRRRATHPDILVQNRKRIICLKGSAVLVESEVSKDSDSNPLPEELALRLEATWKTVIVE